MILDGSSPILLVEDDRVDVEFFKRALKKSGIPNPVYVADDGAMALDILLGLDGQEKLQQPALLIVDINMPRMNGLELLGKIRGNAALESSVVFVLTTSRRKEDQDGAFSLKAAGYFMKDNADMLIARLKDLLNGVAFKTS